MSDNPGAAGSSGRLFELIDRIIETPGRREELTREISQTFTRRQAVLVLDMSGFSRTTQLHGVVAFLVMIHQMRRLSAPVIAARGGSLLKAEADNLYCLFDTVDDAVRAAQEIVGRLTEAARAALDPAVATAPARASISGLTLLYHAVH